MRLEIALTAALAVALIAQIAVTAGLSGVVSRSLAVAQQRAEPVRVTVRTIAATDCTACKAVDLSPALRSAGAVVDSEPVPASERATFIARYGIARLPAAVVTGNLSRVALSGSTERDGALVVQSGPPYEDAGTGTVRGIVGYRFDPARGCDVCTNLSPILAALNESGVSLVENEGLPVPDRTPAIVFDRELSAYPNVIATLARVGLVNTSTGYALEAPAPYVENGRVRGLVDLTLIEPTDCSDCYDATVHERILAAYHVAVESVTELNESGAADIIARYGIHMLPTAVITGDIGAYPTFDAVWRQVGTVEPDGAYVFRDPTALGANATTETI